MQSSHRTRGKGLAMALMAVPFALTMFLPIPAAAADGSAPAVSAEGVDQQPDPASAQTTVAPGPPESPPTIESPAPSEPPTVEPPPDEQSPPTEEPPLTDVSTDPDPEEVEPVAEVATEQAEATTPAPSADPHTAALQQQRVRAPEPKVTICHRTFDRTNPYNQITVTIPFAKGHAAQHDGPIYTPDGPRGWGDIIPPIPDLPNGHNWPEGRAILNDGCEVKPDPGPLPDAVIGEVECVGAVPSLEVTVSNDPDATAPALFNIFADDTLVQTVGPVAPGDSETVTLTAGPLGARENQTFTVEVRSGGEVIASEVISVDCAPPPPPPGVEITAELTCGEGGAQGTLIATNNGPDPATVTATANGDPLGQPLVVGPGATATSTADLSQFEDQTITVNVFVNGDMVATYDPMPDCELAAVPEVAVAGLECPPPSATATLSNTGDPESTVVFTILVDGKVVQQTAPLFGGDTTTIVGDLTPYEDQTVTIELKANGEVLGSRTLTVNCRRATGPDSDLDVAPADAGRGGPSGAHPGNTGSAQPSVPTSVPAGIVGNNTVPAATGTGTGTGVGLAVGSAGLAGCLLLMPGSRRRSAAVLWGSRSASTISGTLEYETPSTTAASSLAAQYECGSW